MYRTNDPDAVYWQGQVMEWAPRILGALAILEWKAHWAALAGLASALAVSVIVYGMPVSSAAATAVYGAAFGLLPIGWIVVNAVFLYNLTVETGQFEIDTRVRPKSVDIGEWDERGESCRLPDHHWIHRKESGS